MLAIIIHSDSSCPKVDVAADLAVADVGQMTRFGIFADRRTFDFDKVSNMDIFGEARILDEYGAYGPTVTPSATVLSSIIELVITAPAQFHCPQYRFHWLKTVSAPIFCVPF